MGLGALEVRAPVLVPINLAALELYEMMGFTVNLNALPAILELYDDIELGDDLLSALYNVARTLR